LFKTTQLSLGVNEPGVVQPNPPVVPVGTIQMQAGLGKIEDSGSLFIGVDGSGIIQGNGSGTVTVGADHLTDPPPEIVPLAMRV
jgi:hypothetical protein